MSKLVFWSLWAFVFSLPWENAVFFDWIGTLSRFLGALALALGLLSVLGQGRVRRPGIILSLAAGFTLATVVSMLWTISSEATILRVRTYVQLLGIVWLVWEFGREKRDSLLVAYCLGGYVASADALNNFRLGLRLADLRYAGSNFDPNAFGLTLTLGIPIAWYLFMTCRGIIRVMGGCYIPLASVAILLTASRGTLLSALVALSIIPMSLLRGSVRSWATGVAVLLVAAGVSAIVVPDHSWDRLLTTRQELAGGGLNGRWPIWQAGWLTFLQHPMLGVGAGAFEIAVEPVLGLSASHNVLLAVLVEQGIAGLSVFAALLGACGWLICRLPADQRRLWAAISLAWVVGTMSLSWQYNKVTWLLFGLLAVTAAAAKKPPIVREQRSVRRAA